MVKRGHRGATRGQAGVTGGQHEGSASIQRRSKTRHSDSGRVLIHLVLTAHYSLHGSPYSPLPLLLYFEAQWLQHETS